MRSIFLVSLALAATSALAADWRQFRGNRVDGLAEPADTYPSTGFAKAWTVDLPGRGLSSPIVVEGNVIVTCASGPEQKRLHVLCFDEQTGALKWERQFWATGRTMCHEKTCVAAPTPASDGKRIFALYSSNDLVCLDLEGNLQWLRGLTVDYPNASNSLGLATSPVFVGNTLVAQIENDSESFAAGIDPYTGGNQWKIERARKANWCSPVIVGDNTVVLQGSAGLDGVDSSTGKALWSYKSGASTIPSSAVGADGIVYTPSNGLTALKPNATDTPDLVWEVGKIRPGTASPILIGDRVFTINTANVIDCADAKTGQELWSTRLEGPISGSPVAAGNRIYVFAERKGLGQIVDVSGEGEAKITGTIELEDTILCTPALANGAVFVRSDAHLWKLVGGCGGHGSRVMGQQGTGNGERETVNGKRGTGDGGRVAREGWRWLLSGPKALPQASPGQARNERRPGYWQKMHAKPQRGVTIGNAAIPRPRRHPCCIQSTRPCLPSLSGRRSPR